MTIHRIRTAPSGPIQEIDVPDLPISSDDVTNESSVSGATVTAALETLAAAGSSVLALSTVRYCDRGTAVPVPQQNGSEAFPFSSLQAALTSLEAVTAAEGAIMLAPGDYSAETGLTFTGAMALQMSALEVVSRTWQTSTGPLIADMNYSGAVSLKMNGIQHGDIDAGVASLGLENCSSDTSNMGSAGGVISAFNCFFGNDTVMVAQNLRLRSCEVRGLSMTAGGTVIEITNTEWTVNGAIAFSGAAGDLRLDSMSEFYWDAMGVSATLTNGTIVPLYLP